MKNIDWKEIIVTVLIGATVAFITTFMEGVKDALNGNFSEVTGATAAMTKHLLRNIV